MSLQLYTNDGAVLRIGYINFGWLRWDIAYSVSRELGDAYKAFYLSLPLTEDQTMKWEAFLEISEKYDNDLIDFLSHSDSSGHLLSSQCKRLYKLFRDLEVNHDKFHEFLEFLKHSADKRRKVYFC